MQEGSKKSSWQLAEEVSWVGMEWLHIFWFLNFFGAHKEEKMSSSPDIAGILDNTKELDRLKKEQEEVIIEINKMHKKLQASEFLEHFFDLVVVLLKCASLFIGIKVGLF